MRIVQWIIHDLTILLFFLYIGNYLWVEKYVVGPITLIAHRPVSSIKGLVQLSIISTTIILSIIIGEIPYAISYGIEGIGHLSSVVKQTYEDVKCKFVNIRQRCKNAFGNSNPNTEGTRENSSIEEIRKKFVILLSYNYSSEDPDKDIEQDSANIGQIREETIQQLESGELTLTLVVSIFTAVIQFSSYNFLSKGEFAGVPPALIIKLYLLALAVSMIFRKYWLKRLTYSEPPEYVDEYRDEVTAYQKGMTGVSRIQVFMISIVAVYHIHKPTYDWAMTVMDLKFNEGLNWYQSFKEISGVEWPFVVWQSLR